MSVKISALTAISSVDDADLLAIVDSSETETKKVTIAQLAAAIGGTSLPDWWTDEGAGQLRLNSAVMSGGPLLTFVSGAKTITRSNGSWLLDGFAVGQTINIRNCTDDADDLPKNNGTYTITVLTSTVMTVAEAIATSMDDNGSTFIEGGPFLDVGGEDAGAVPEYGAIRVREPGYNYTDSTLVSAINGSGDTYPVLSFSKFGTLGIGGSTAQSNQADGNVIMPDTIGLWANDIRMYAPDGRSYRDDRGAFTTYQSDLGYRVETTDATPTSVGVTIAVTGAAPATIIVRAVSFGGERACWVATNGRIVHQEKSAGASTWSYDATTGMGTGQAATQIVWTVYTNEPVFACRLREIDGVVSILHPGGGVITVPNSTFTIPTSGGGGTPTGTGLYTATSGVMDAAALAASTSGNLLQSNGTTWASTAPSFNASVITAGTLAVARGGTGITSLATGMATWLGSGTSADLRSALTDETGTGACVFATAPTVTALASDYVALGGGTPHTTALLRVPYSTSQVIIGAKNSAAGDYGIIEKQSATDLVIGHQGAWDTAIRGFTTTVWGQGSVSLYGGGSNTICFTADGTTNRACLPLAGFANGSVPFRFKQAAITQSSTATTTLTAAQYECPSLMFTGTPGGTFDVVAPDSVGATYFVRNDSGSTMNFKKSGGTAVAIVSTGAAVVIHNGTDYKLIAIN